MDSSNEINKVVVDGQLTSVSVNDETIGLYSQDEEQTQNEEPSQAGEEQPQNIEQEKESWRREKDVESAINTNTEANADNTAEEVIEIEESDTNAKKSSWLGNFSAGLLNVCTLGLKSPSASPVVPDQTMVSAEKIVQDLARSEQGLDLNETMQSEQDHDEYMKDRALLSVYSVPSDEVSSADSIVSQLTKKRRTKKIAFYAIGIGFCVMVGLFITGGILFSRSGW